MALTMWTNTLTGKRLDAAGLAAFRMRARVAYAANTHIFEDESEALTALGIVPTLSLAAQAA